MFASFATVAEFARLTPPASPPRHRHTLPSQPHHGFFAEASDFFAVGARPSGKEIGM